MADTDRYQWWEQALDWRGIAPEDACERCSGSGARAYASTATWRGGIGGQTITNGVCDACWGSGDRHRPWTDLRKLEREMEARVQARAADLLAARCGATFPHFTPALRALATELERLANKRTPPAPFWSNLCDSLALTLREFAAHGGAHD